MPMAPLILGPVTVWTLAVIFTRPSLYPRGKMPCTPRMLGWVDPRASVGVERKEKPTVLTANRAKTPRSSSP
jgi:hypothetical protein